MQRPVTVDEMKKAYNEFTLADLAFLFLTLLFVCGSFLGIAAVMGMTDGEDPGCLTGSCVRSPEGTWSTTPSRH